jgi:hypothetical protein
LLVTGVIDGFHTDDNLHQRGIVLADALDQTGLGIGRPRDENRTGVCDRLRDSLKEGVILPRHARSRWSLPYGGSAWFG